MYLILQHIILKGKIKCNGIIIIFILDLRRETVLTVSDRWQEFLCPFGRKEPDVRKSTDIKIKRFEFTPVDHIHR